MTFWSISFNFEFEVQRRPFEPGSGDLEDFRFNVVHDERGVYLELAKNPTILPNLLNKKTQSSQIPCE